MIDKPFLEQQLQALQNQHGNLLRAVEQTIGAILFTQSLLKKAEDETAAGASAPAVVVPPTSEV